MNSFIVIAAQTDPTQGITEVLSFPIETILAGALLFIGLTGIVLGWAFLRMSNNLTKSNETRNDIERELITVLRSTNAAIGESLTAAKQSAMSSEATNQSVTRMNTEVHEYMEIQRKIVVPALKTIYYKVDQLDKRFAKFDNEQIHEELRGLRDIITSVAQSIVRTTAKANIGED